MGLKQIENSSTSRPSWAHDPSVTTDAALLSTCELSSAKASSRSVKDIVDAIMHMPGNMIVARLRTLHSQRVRCAPLEPDLYEVALAFRNITDTIDDRIGFTEGLAGHHSTWDRLLEAGIADLCEEIVEEGDFELEHPYWIITVLSMVSATVVRRRKQLVNYESPHSQQVLRILARLCYIANKHRELFVDDNIPLKTYAPGASRHLRFFMHHILSEATYFYTLVSPDGSEVSIQVRSIEEGRQLGRLSMHLWYCRAPTDDTMLAEMMLPFGIDAVCQFSPSDFFDFFENEAIKPMGPLNLLKSVSTTLGCDAFDGFDYHRALLQSLSRIIASRSLWPHYSASGFLRALWYMLDSHSSHTSPSSMSQYWTLLEPALELLIIMTDAAPMNDAAGPLIRQFDIVELIARSTRIYAQVSGFEHNTRCLEAIVRYTQVAAALGVRSGKNILRKAFRQAAQRVWYRTLKTLRELPSRNRQAKRRCAQLIPAWKGLGVALDLNEADEKAAYDREMKVAAQLCAWFKCEYHEKEPPLPARACAGCGEVRYCSRPCQQKDWKEGGHKLICKRLKNEPHQPRHNN